MGSLDRKLKAYVRIDGMGRIVAGSLILRRKMPKTGKWIEINAYECCNPPAFNCITYEVTGVSTLDATFTYTDCSNTIVGPYNIAQGVTDTFCAREATIALLTGEATFVAQGACTTSTTTTSGPR